MLLRPPWKSKNFRETCRERGWQILKLTGSIPWQEVLGHFSTARTIHGVDHEEAEDGEAKIEADGTILIVRG
jgi:hypothetical protein